MSNLRKAPLLAIAGALGVVTAVSAVAYAITIATRSKTAGPAVETEDNSRTAADRERVMTPSRQEAEEEEEAATPPLTMAPAAPGSKALVVCSEGREEAVTAAGWAAASRGAGAAVSVCPPDHLSSHAKAAAGSYDFVVVEEAGKGKGEISDAVLGEVLKLLKVGGKAAVVVSSAIGGGGDNTATVMTTTMTTTKRELTFAGFVSVSVSSKDERIVFGERPAWAVGASAPVRLSFKSKPQNVEASKLAAGVATATAAVNGNSNGTNVAANGTGSVGKKATWKLALDDDDVGGGMFGEAVGDGGEGEEDDLVDEDALLEASAPVKRTTETDADGCATKRRACKDCSCGRAEMEAQEALPGPVVSVGDVDDALTSACGNCSKGDAFRCGGCPFLGKPAFEKGQEKLIMLSDLDSQQDN